jgi:hypothetical protein
MHDAGPSAQLLAPKRHTARELMMGDFNPDFQFDTGGDAGGAAQPAWEFGGAAPALASPHNPLTTAKRPNTPNTDSLWIGAACPAEALMLTPGLAARGASAAVSAPPAPPPSLYCTRAQRFRLFTECPTRSF